MTWKRHYMTLFFPLMGLLFITIGIPLLLDSRQKLKKWIRVEGTVIEMGEREGSKGKILFYPVYRYQLNGKEHTGAASVASSPPCYKVGDRVRIIVNPADDTTSDVLDSNIWIFPAAALGLGLLTFMAGCLVCWLAFTGRMR